MFCTCDTFAGAKEISSAPSFVIAKADTSLVAVPGSNLTTGH